jgi:tRNA(fMet)-specific endonuclease VapC
MRQHAAVMNRLSAIRPAECAISTVTSYELYTGVEKCSDPVKERAKVDQFLAAIHELSFDRAAALECSQIRALLESQGLMIGPYDVLLAGHAKSIGLTLVTANTREFGRVPSLKLENWELPFG